MEVQSAPLGNLLVMEIFDYRTGETDQGAITLVLGSAQGV